ncbi:MAG: hypothetical protein JO217_03870 [Acidobacteriaceae bacterium]|nr:hypothetical protein [Acidobacteriaceae bacterium]MBV9441812.1 hypothetical protein [Acidobacteriaceae bacterium]
MGDAFQRADSFGWHAAHIVPTACLAQGPTPISNMTGQIQFIRVRNIQDTSASVQLSPTVNRKL